MLCAPVNGGQAHSESLSADADRSFLLGIGDEPLREWFSELALSSGLCFSALLACATQRERGKVSCDVTSKWKELFVKTVNTSLEGGSRIALTESVVMGVDVSTLLCDTRPFVAAVLQFLARSTRFQQCLWWIPTRRKEQVLED